MTRWLATASAMLVALVLSTHPALAFQGTQKGTKPTPGAEAKAEAKEKAATNKDRVDGTLESVDKAKSMLLIRTRPDGNLRQVILNAQTAYTVQNKTAAVDDLRTGHRVICTGQLNDKGQLAAVRCEMRQQK